MVGNISINKLPRKVLKSLQMCSVNNGYTILYLSCPFYEQRFGTNDEHVAVIISMLFTIAASMINNKCLSLSNTKSAKGYSISCFCNRFC